MKRFTPIFFLLICTLTVDLFAQRSSSVTYESLLMRSDQPNAYTSHVLLPDEDGKTTFATLFRLDFDFLPFLRVRSNMEDVPAYAEYFSPLRMGVEINHGEFRENRRRQSEGEVVYRSTYQDTVYASSFDQTRSRFDHAQGYIVTQLEPGQYNYELQLTRGESVRQASSRRVNFHVAKYEEADTTRMMLLADHWNDGDLFQSRMLNFGTNVIYGQDYTVLVPLPKEDRGPYSLSITRLMPGEGVNPYPDKSFEHDISPDELLSAGGYEFEKRDGSVYFSMNRTIPTARFAVVDIPNADFENARFRIAVTDNEGKNVSRLIINSQWIDMPISLYNLDVAINMMQFIVDDQQLRELRSGSQTDRERKFREFWEQRDPTPDTEFNELMAEYYARIDYAYANFTTPQTAGYASDQGRAYILFGEPENINRQLRTSGPTQEIWEYGNRTLVFEATSGFGDFKLVREL
ncbi:MAG: GWxTD domain-containing protein [Balneolaceae bacterium]